MDTMKGAGVVANHDLTDRDVEVLGYVCRHGLCSPAQIARATRPNGGPWFSSEWAAYRRLRAVASLGLAEKHRTWWHGPQVVAVTKMGAKLAAVDLAPARLDMPRLGHALAVVDLSEMLLAEHPGSAWVTERELRRDALRRQREEGMRTEHVWRPRTADGMLIRPDGKRVAVELDLSPKQPQTIEAILKAYVDQVGRGVDAVWWHAPTKALRDRVSRVVDTLGLAFLVGVHDFWPDTDLPKAYLNATRD